MMVLSKGKQKVAIRRYKIGSNKKLITFRNLIASLSAAEIRKAYGLLNLLTRYSSRQTDFTTRIVQAIPLENTLAKWDLIPQAVIARPLEAFTRHVNSRISSGFDSLDEYSGVAFAMDGAPFAVMHYKGHPPETSTIYLPRDFSAVPEITNFIRQIMTRFELPTESVVWQRKDNPEL